MKNSVNSSLAHRQAVCNLPSGYSKIFRHKGVHCSNLFLSDDHLCLTWSWHVHCTHTSMMKITTPSENCSTWHTLSPIHILHSTVNVGSTNTFCRQKLDYCALSLFGGIHGTIVNCYLAQKAQSFFFISLYGTDCHLLAASMYCYKNAALQSFLCM